MGDNSFLKHFITEPVFVIPGEELSATKAAPKEEKVETVAEEATEVYGQPEPEQKQVKELVFKGSNSRQVLVIVDQPAEEFINATDEAFLSKIIGAIKLDINDIAIANFPKNDDLNKETLLKFNATRYIVFGVDDSKLFKDNLPPYQIIDMDSGKQVLNCSSLAAIAGDATQKKLLWTALQKMFL